MNIVDIKNIFEEAAARHKDIESFDLGLNYQEGERGNAKYPQLFFETDFTCIEEDKVFSYGISIAMFVRITQNANRTEKLENLSVAETYIRDVIDWIRENYGSTMWITYDYNYLTFYDITTDKVDGLRVEMTVNVAKTNCDIDDKFGAPTF